MLVNVAILIGGWLESWIVNHGIVTILAMGSVCFVVPVFRRVIFRNLSGVSFLAALILGLIAQILLARSNSDSTPVQLQAALIFYATAIILVGVSVASARKSSLVKPIGFIQPVVVLFLILGAGLRIYHLDTHTQSLDEHDLNQANIALSLMRGDLQSYLANQNGFWDFVFDPTKLNSAPAIFPASGCELHLNLSTSKALSNLISALWFSWFGLNIISMRLLSVTVGMLFLGCFYLFLCYALNDRLVALIGLWLTAVCPYMINFSRYASDSLHAMTSVHAVVVAYLSLKIVRTGRFGLYIGLGFIIGLSIVIYESSIFMFPIAAIFLFLQAVIRWWQRDRLRFLTGAILTTVIAGLLIWLKLGNWVDIIEQKSFKPTSQIAQYELVDNIPDLVKNCLLVVRSHFVFADRCELYKRPSAIINSALLPFLVIGLVIAVAQIRRCEYQLLLIWLFGGALSAALFSFVVSRRFLASMPAAYALIAIAMARFINILLQQARSGRFRIGLGIVAGGTLITLVNIHIFFTEPLVTTYTAPGRYKLGIAVRKWLQDYHIYLLLDERLTLPAKGRLEDDAVYFMAHDLLGNDQHPNLEFVTHSNWQSKASRPTFYRNGAVFMTNDRKMTETMFHVLSELYPKLSRSEEVGATLFSIPPDDGSSANRTSLELSSKIIENIPTLPQPISFDGEVSISNAMGGKPKIITATSSGEIIVAFREPSGIGIFSKTGKALMGFLFGHGLNSNPIALTANDKYLVVSFSDHTIATLDRSGRIFTRWSVEAPVYSMACDDDEIFMVLSDYSPVHAYSFEGKLIRLLPSQDEQSILPVYPLCVARGPTGRLAIADIRQRIWFCNPATGQLNTNSSFACRLDCSDGLPKISHGLESTIFVTDSRGDGINVYQEGRVLAANDSLYDLLPSSDGQISDFCVVGSYLYVCYRNPKTPAKIYDLQGLYQILYGVQR